jgi:D-glycero-alpha-D-manno-heptose-7-phosphate kinase
MAIDSLILPPSRMAELQSHLLLVYTGIARTAADVAKSYVHDLEARRRQLRIMKELVEESIDILASGSDIRAFGELLHEAWQAKRSLSPQVSNSEIDDLYTRARAAGALGGKLTGAGGGGFLLLFVEPDRRADVLAALPGRVQVPFQFDTAGSQIIFYEPQKEYEPAERAWEAPLPFRELVSSDITAEAS